MNFWRMHRSLEVAKQESIGNKMIGGIVSDSVAMRGQPLCCTTPPCGSNSLDYLINALPHEGYLILVKEETL